MLLFSSVVPEASISVAPQSKGVCLNFMYLKQVASLLPSEMFAMTKLHKDIAMRLMECVQDDSLSDQAVIKVSMSGHACVHAKSTYFCTVVPLI